MNKIGYSKRDKRVICTFVLLSLISLIVGLIVQEEIRWAFIFLPMLILFVLLCIVITLDYYFYDEEYIKVKNLSGKTWQIKWKEIKKVEKRDIGGRFGTDAKVVFLVFKEGNLKKPHLMLRGDDELLTVLKRHYDGLIFDYIDSRYL